MKLIEYYHKAMAVVKWVLGKIFLVIAFVTAMSIATGYSTMTGVEILLSGIFMLLAVTVGFILDSNIILNRLQRRCR